MAFSLCIHIGMPKTGTSLMQAVLSAMRETLGTQGVWAPPSFLGSHRLAIAATPENRAIHDRADFVEIKAAMSLESALDQPRTAVARFDTVMLSSEYFSECSPRQLKTLLHSQGIQAAEISIIAALRRQDRILASGFNQDVKALHRTRPLTWTPAKAERHDWHALLQPWAEEFGKDRIKVQVFDRAAAAAESLTCLLLDTCGVRYDAATVRRLEERYGRSENRSLPADLLAFKFFANAVTERGQLDWLIDLALARGVGRGSFQLDARTVRMILEHYRESNRRVAAEYLGETGDLFDDDIDEEAVSTLRVTPVTITELLALCAEELKGLRAAANEEVLEAAAE